MTRPSLTRLAPWVLALVSLFLAIEQAKAGEYTIVITNVWTTPYGKCNFDDGDNEEWVWKIEFPPTGANKCFWREVDETVNATVQYSIDFTSSRPTVGMNIEYYEKDQDNMCTYESGDDGHDEFTLTFDLTTLAVNQTRLWSAPRKSPGSDCYMGMNGFITRFPDAGGEPVPGSPRISSANLTIVSGQVHLSIEGHNLDPDDQEPPTIQISGVETSCKASTIVKSNTNISCDIVPPETDKVSNLQNMQVMVQTAYGATRNVPIYFPKCKPACNSENGTCYWSQEAGGLECVCKSYLNYGPTCDSTYPDGEPILQAVSPIGGDYTKEIVIGVSGRVFAEDDSTITDVICEVSYSGSNQRLDPSGTRIITTREVIWNGSVIPYDNRNIPQTDSLQVKGMCIIPAGTISSLRDDKKNAVVTLIWKRGVTNQMIESKDQRTFYLYGAFDKDSSIVRMVTNPADTEVKVFRDQYLQVIVLDAKGNNRVGGEDADLFFVEWFDGPSSEPRFGIKGGVTKEFKYAKCRTNTNDNTCAYYQITQSFDFAGQFKANVFTTNPATLNLDKINKGDIVFDVKGLGEVTLLVPPPLPSSISWADQLQNRSKIPVFSKSLGQLVSPNTGARDKTNVLAPLFKRWKGGWFSQRQTVSLGFETGMSKVMLGSVHVVRGQGITEDLYCDAHTDELDAGALSKQLKAWERTGNVPHTFPLIGSGFSDGDCITSISVVIELVHRNPNSVSFTLSRTGMPNTSPRAKNITTDIVLKTATESTASTGSGVPSPVVYVYSSGSVAGLTNLRGLPAVADWKLTVDSPSERGHVKDWYINVQTEYCLKSSIVDNSICGDGGGQFYARAANVEDTLRLECPQGGVISEIQWARFGKLDGSCELNNVQVYDDCEADPALVMSRVARECVGYTSCELNAIDTEFGAVQGEPYLCPGQLPPCPDDVSVLVPEDSSSSQSKRGLRNKRKETTWLERELPSTYPGTEDYYYKTTHIRHYSEPFIRPRRADDAPTCSYNSQRPKKALMVKAVCKDSNAAFSFTDSSLQSKRMLVASAAADFDNDWKDETVTLFGYEMGPLHASFTFIQGGKPVTTVYKDIQIGGQAVVLGGQIEVQAGDFDNDGYPELVIGFIDSTGALKLYLWDLSIDDSTVWGAAAKGARSNLQPCGCWNTGNIITRLFDEASPISVPTNPAFPVRMGSTRLDSPGYSFSLSSGDVALALYDYLVVSWIADAGGVSWQLYQRSEDGLAPVSADPVVLRSLNKPHAISAQLGNYDGSGYSTLAVGVVDDKQVRVYLYSIDTNEDELPMKQVKVISLYDDEKPSLWGYDASAYSRANLVLESGDVDDDGDDDIIVGFTARSKAFIYRIDAPGSGTKCRKLECMEKFGNIDFTLSAGYAKTNNAFLRSPELKIAIGNMDDTYQNEVLVALEYTSSSDSSVAKIMLTSLTAQPNEDDPFSINGRHCYSGPYYQTTEKTDNLVINNMGLTVSNLYGLGYRVGQPTTVRYEGVPDLIAVINAPPTHYDVLGDDEVIVNPGTFSGAGSFTQLSNVEGVVSSFEITRETASARTSSHGFQLNARIAVVFGNVDLAWQDFTNKAENTGNAFLEQIAVARDLVASGDDVVLYTSTDKDVYKYPIVDQSGSQVGSLDVVMSSSCGEKCVQKADGRDLWWFTPDHEPFNLLTYSSRAPSDFNPVNRIMVGEKVTLGPNAHEQWVDQQSGKSQNKVSLNHTSSRAGAGGGAGAQVSLDYYFAASFMGVGPQIKMPIGVEVSAGYVGRTETSDDSMNAETHSAAINRDASVHSYVEAINPKYAYKVQPYVYMARTGSGQEYLKVDYSAEPGYYPGVSTWWQRTYDKPDPTFNMPWWWTTFKRDRTMLTKEMTATPLFPKVGEVVQVTVTVRNKALVAVTDVSLSLWRGSPENCLDLTCLFPGRTLIGAVNVGLIPAQDKRDITFLFKHDGTNNIHATLDDKNEVEEMHEDNNEAYSLMFYNLRDNGYTLQTIRLSPGLTFTPVRGGTNNKYVKGYDVYATVLGDTFTRQNVLVQFWHGAVGGSGRLISTVNIPRLRGSVTTTTSYRVAVYWDTSNPSLYGEQEVYAVILHSGFDTTDDNIISQVKQKVSVSCYGDVDVCGVCGGDNSACRGCDGVPLSGKTVDVCGKCGGDGSTCCVRKPSQAKVHYFKLGTDSDSSTKRVKVGDLVVWENFLDWNVKITGGVYDYVGAPAYSLDTLKYKGFDIQGEVPPMTLDDETVGAYVQQYLSMVTMKDHVEFDDTAARPTPLPDTTNKYLRRSIVAHTAADELPADFDNLGLARFPGWHVERPTVNLEESRLVFEPRVKSSRHQEEEEDQYGDEDEDDYIVEMEASMEGICCAEPDFFDEDEGAQKTRKRVARSDSSVEKQLAGLLQRRSKALHTDSKSVGRALRAPTPAFSLRSVALSLLQKQKEQTKFLDSINATAIELDADILMARRREATRSFYDATTHERDLLAGTDDVDGDGLDEGVHCLCARRRSASSGLRKRLTDEEKAAKAEQEKADSEKVDQADKLGGTSAGAGSLGPAEVGTAAEMTGTTSYGVPTFSGFGAARGWTLYDFSEIARAAASDPDVLAPGAVSAPHRFFSPGIYMWHDSNNPAIHGTIIVDPSDLLIDACGVCGGNGTTCLDCKGTPRGNARRDVCGVCYDPLVDAYDPNKAKDCAGVCNGTAKIDECGFCAGGSTGLVAGFAKDCAGVCNGTQPSLCGVCGATQDTRPDLLDCAGECFGLRVVNKCGFCVGGSSGLDVSYGMDCAGECNGTAVRDCFSLCQGTAKVDCAGVCNGTARTNKCDRCVGGATGLDDAMTKRCDGVCAIKPAEVCGSNSTTSATKRFVDDSDIGLQDETSPDADVATSLFDVRQACTGTYDCAGVCNGTSSNDKRGTCCAAEQIDCAGLCRGSATIECGVCVGGSSGKDSSQVRDCMGVCNGTAKYNPCGVCATPENYYNGSGYRVDCNNVCNGSAYIDSCGKCVEGTTGRLPNADQDCQGVCFGKATTDGCGVCYIAGDGHVPNKDMDCAGVCNGTAVKDDCGQCALGTTKKEFNADKDCAGQCFGQHIITDPACSCPAGQLDQCFVCGGNNTQCAGCDGVPNSLKVRDFCGVCGGNNTQCCFLPFAQTTATIKDFETIVLRNELETGETLRISNLHAGYAYSLIMYRLDVPADVARVKQIQTRWDYATLRPGNSLDIIISEPGVYRITSVESSSVAFALTVSYNSKALDVCGRCVYPARTAGPSSANKTLVSSPDSTEYDHCCTIMPDNNVHNWYQTTFFYHADVPHVVTRVVPHTETYHTSTRQHLVRLIEPHRIDSATWCNRKKLSVGDVLTFENADSVDHVLSFSGTQPLPDVYLERGRTVTSMPLLKPGAYRLVSNKNMINTTFTVEFPFECTVYAPEPVPEDDHTLLIALTASLGGALVVVVLAGLVAVAAVVIYKCATRAKPDTLKDTTLYPL